MNKNIFYTTILYFFILLFSNSCKKEESSTTSSPSPIQYNYKLMVVDEMNQPISNAKITDGANSINSNSSGSAIFNSPKESYGKYRFSITKDGYFSGSLNLITSANTDSTFKVMLLKSSDSSKSIPSSGGSASGSGWTFTSTGGFKNSNGTIVTGNVITTIRYIKPDDFLGLKEAFPGQDFIAPQGTQDNILFVYGWVAINYTLNGERVFPVAGSVSIKVQVPGKYANAAQNGGKVFYYDEVAKVWEESANPTISGLDVTMPLPSEASFCALGKLEPTSTIKYSKTICRTSNQEVYAVQIEYDEAKYYNYLKSIVGHTYYSFPIYGLNSIAVGSGYFGKTALGHRPYLVEGTVTNSTNNPTVNGLYYSDNPKNQNESFTFLTAYNGGFRVHSLKLKTPVPLNDYYQNDVLEDKVIKEYASFPQGVTSLGKINTACDGSGGGGSSGSGQFTYDGQTYSGNCFSSPAVDSDCSIDVSIIPNNTSIRISIYNMPIVNSGTINVVEVLNGSNCEPEAILTVNSTESWGSVSGTITKTGAKTFTFSISVKNSSNGTIKNIYGSGSY